MKRYDEILADYNRAIELDPGNAWAISGRGQTYRLMKRYGETLADYTRAIELVSPDLREQLAATCPRSRTGPNGSGLPRGYLRI